MKYVGGQTYLEKVPSNFKYADLLHRLSEKVDDAVSVKWLAPGDDLDPEGLISLTDDSDLQVSGVLSCTGMKRETCNTDSQTGGQSLRHDSLL